MHLSFPTAITIIAICFFTTAMASDERFVNHVDRAAKSSTTSEQASAPELNDADAAKIAPAAGKPNEKQEPAHIEQKMYYLKR